MTHVTIEMKWTALDDEQHMQLHKFRFVLHGDICGGKNGNDIQQMDLNFKFLPVKWIVKWYQQD